MSAELLAQTADRIQALGLADAGYRYINSDDCWASLGRDNHTGRIRSAFFPDSNDGGDAGMRNLSRYIHGKNLLFGLYGAASEVTCAKREGNLYHEMIDAQTLADWGVDYFKYDACGEDNLQAYAKFQVMRDALNATGRAIVYSFEPHGSSPYDPVVWPRQTGNSWRTGHDIRAGFGAILAAAHEANAWAHAGGPGGWPDADMLEVGNPGLSVVESRSHFALWCLIKSPLLIGCDLATINASFLEILTNRELIALSQDPLGQPGWLRNTTAGPDPSYRIPLPATTLTSPPQLRKSPQSFGLITECELVPDDGVKASPTQRWSIDIDKGTISQGTVCLGVTGSGIGESANPVVVAAKCDGSVSQQWLAATANLSLTTIRTAKLYPSTVPAQLPGGVWFDGPIPGAPMDQKTGRRCGLNSPGNDTSSALCHDANPKSGVIAGINLTVMQQRCAADSTCVGFGRCSDKNIDAPLFTPMANISSRGGDLSCQTWLRKVGSPPPPPAPSPLCLATSNDGSQLQLEPCVQDPLGCHTVRCTQSVRVRQLWYAARSGQLLSSWAGRGTNDLPRCLSTTANAQPPSPPRSPPDVNPALPLQVWAAPLSGGRVAVVLLNAAATAAVVTADWASIGLALGTRVKIRDAIHHTDNGTSCGPQISATVSSHDAVVYVLSPTTTTR